ncbi:MAG: VOC family protein [Acidobacteria bacterium]|nr:VOC family protein [Acidobacteriota bacterium]
MRIESIHHVSLNVTDLERSKNFYREILGLEEIPRPAFGFPGAWFAAGGAQQVHLIVHSGATFRGEKGIDPKDNHFAVRVSSYSATVEFLRSQGYREDADALDLKHMRLQPHATAGFPQIYILDPDRHVIEINAAGLPPAAGRSQD